ncbi:MAG: hypothetical protein OEO83_10325 [Alphaproteobacteria bacterium]|nr:hypothetical protein [Alphaproteobacteria bacterium]
MKVPDKKKLLVAGTALVALLGLSACHHWHGRDHGPRYHGPSHAEGDHHDRRGDDREYRRRGYRN